MRRKKRGDTMNRNLLRAKMIEAGYNQRTLAKKIGMAQNTLSSRMTEKTAFDVVEIDRICTALNIINGDEKAAIFLVRPS